MWEIEYHCTVIRKFSSHYPLPSLLLLAGDRGEIGPQGPPGDTGGVGTTGAKGEEGDMGQKGEPGNRGLQGVRGDTGETGAMGEKGEKGEKGEPAQGGGGGGGTSAGLVSWNQCAWANLNMGQNFGQLVVSVFVTVSEWEGLTAELSLSM